MNDKDQETKLLQAVYFYGNTVCKLFGTLLQLTLLVLILKSDKLQCSVLKCQYVIPWLDQY